MKIKGLRWWVLCLTSIITTLNILDRGTLNYMWKDEVKTELDGSKTVIQRGIANELELIEIRSLTSEELALPQMEQDRILDTLRDDRSKEILAAIYIFFMIAYGISQILFGKIFDRVGTRKGFVISDLIWGWAMVFTAFVNGLKSLTIFRVMLGLGEGGPWPGVAKANAEWFPVKERATAQGVFGAASSVGNILSPILISLLFLSLGWRAALLILGVVSLLWIIPWWIIVKSPPKKHPWITDAEKAHILGGQTDSHVADDKTVPMRKLLSSPQSFAVILSRLFLDPIWWIFMTWLPIYLKEVYHLSLESIAAMAWIPFLGAAVGGIAGGWLSGKFLSRGKSLNFARKCTITLGGLMMIPGMIGTAFASSALIASLCLIFVLGGFQFAIVNIQTLPSDFHTGKTVGSLAGLGGAAAVLGTIAMMYLVPVLTAGGNWTPLFMLGIILVPLALVSIFTLAGKIEQTKR